MDPEELFALVFVTGMIAGVLVILMAMRQRSQQLEMLHRERMAMIERGQSPAQFDSAVAVPGRGSPLPVSRSLSLGIVIVGLGLSLMTIISIAGESPASGVGVGGAIAIIGIAFIVNSYVTRQGPGGLPPHAPPPRDQYPD